MSDVRAKRVDRPLITVERECVDEVAVSLAPECSVESVLELCRFALEAIGERTVAPHFTRELGRPDLGVVDVPLHLCRSDRAGCRGAVCERNRFVRVLPALVERPNLRSAAVLDEAVAVVIAVTVDPLQRL